MHGCTCPLRQFPAEIDDQSSKHDGRLSSSHRNISTIKSTIKGS